jgi:hypothetical protein
MWTGLTTPHFCACHKPGVQEDDGLVYIKYTYNINDIYFHWKNIQLTKFIIRITVSLTTPHFCACHKPGHVFLTSFVFDDFRIELIVHFVDIGGLVDHHCLVSIYFYLPLNSKHDWYKWTVVLLVLQIRSLLDNVMWIWLPTLYSDLWLWWWK